MIAAFLLTILKICARNKSRSFQIKKEKAKLVKLVKKERCDNCKEALIQIGWLVDNKGHIRKDIIVCCCPKCGRAYCTSV